MASLYLPIQAVNRSQNVRIKDQKLSVGVTTYVDINDSLVRRDLQRHSAIGAYIIVGSLTPSNSDEVVASGVVPSVSNLIVTVTAGQLLVRSTGAYVTVAGGTTTLDAADGTKDRTDLVWVDGTTGAQGHTNGTAVTAGTSVAPATTAGKIPVATYLVAAGLTVATLVADVRPRPENIGPVVAGNLEITGNNVVDGTLNAKGDTTLSKLGVNGAAAVGKASAYTQTYSTAARTVPAATVGAVATTGSTTSTPYGFVGATQADSIPVAINALAADVIALKKVITAIIDDLQAVGISG